MRKIFCIIVLVLFCSASVFAEKKSVTADKWGQTLYYGDRETMGNVDRYIWFSGQAKLDLNPENATIWGIGSDYTDFGSPDEVKAEAERLAIRDFKIKMKYVYHNLLNEYPAEEFFDEMVKRCRVSRTTWIEKEEGGKAMVWAYCVYSITQPTLKKYYPDVCKVMKGTFE